MNAAPSPARRLTVDLGDMPEEAMTALHREAERRSLPMPVLLGQLVAEEGEHLLSDKGRAAAALSRAVQVGGTNRD